MLFLLLVLLLLILILLLVLLLLILILLVFFLLLIMRLLRLLTCLFHEFFQLFDLLFHFLGLFAVGEKDPLIPHNGRVPGCGPHAFPVKFLGLVHFDDCFIDRFPGGIDVLRLKFFRGALHG